MLSSRRRASETMKIFTVPPRTHTGKFSPAPSRLRTLSTLDAGARSGDRLSPGLSERGAWLLPGMAEKLGRIGRWCGSSAALRFVSIEDVDCLLARPRETGLDSGIADTAAPHRPCPRRKRGCSTEDVHNDVRAPEGVSARPATMENQFHAASAFLSVLGSVLTLRARDHGHRNFSLGL